MKEKLGCAWKLGRLELWRVRGRTSCYKLITTIFGVLSGSFSKIVWEIVRNHWKKWHGPTWGRIASCLFGTSLKLTVDSYGNLMYIRPGQINDLLALFGRLEERPIYEIIASLRTGDCFVDVGAYIGQYTLLASSQVGVQGFVLAIEPDNNNFQLLKRNVKLNACKRVRLLNVALGSEDCTAAQLVMVDADKSISTLDPQLSARFYSSALQRKTQKVKIRTLDSILAELQLNHINLLKLDVEGWELEVLKGASEILKLKKINYIVCEVHGQDKLSDLVDFLKRFGYEIQLTRHMLLLAYL